LQAAHHLTPSSPGSLDRATQYTVTLVMEPRSRGVPGPHFRGDDGTACFNPRELLCRCILIPRRSAMTATRVAPRANLSRILARIAAKILKNRLVAPQ
jgi:hypothetical protein